MSDEARVRDLLAPMQEIPIDGDGRRLKLDREIVVTTILNAPTAILAARAARARRLATLSLAAGFAALVSAGGWFATRRAPARGSPGGASRSTSSPQGQLHISDVSGRVTRRQGPSQITVAEGVAQTVSPEGELLTAEKSEASVTALNGLELRLFENTRVALSELNTARSSGVVHLESGAIRCRVPHLAEGERFSVITPDATVVVHGTVFRVAVGGVAGATHTCVRVEEGVVTVQAATGETRLLSSQSWGCAAPSGADNAASPPAEIAAKPAPAPLPRVRADSARVAAGTLDEENRLFQAGLAAERRGDPSAASQSFERLLFRYPHSPLAVDARAALSRVRPGAP